jgi:hypothetical protein
MAHWSLTGKERDAPDRLRFSTTDAAVFGNATIILMRATASSKASIAYDLGRREKDTHPAESHNLSSTKRV